MALVLPRRKFLTGLVGIIAAPAVVKVESLMKVASPPLIAPKNVWTYESMVTTTLRNQSFVIADLIDNNNALLRALRARNLA